MKKLLLITAVLFTALLNSSAQKIETLKVTGAEYPDFIAKVQYKYPEYKKAKIFFTNGSVATARVNYDYFHQVMKYLGDKNDTLEIANADELSYISIGTDSFFYDNGYYEWVASSATARLAQRINYKESERALVGAFGTTSPAKNIEAHTKLLNEHGVSKDLSPDEIVIVSKETTYFISPITNRKYYSFLTATKSNLYDLFPKKNVQDFIKENKINLNKQEDLIDLMVYISKPK